MTVSKIWVENFHVHTFHMDPKGNVHLTAICNFLQEGASRHAEDAGFGFEDMLKRNQVWVLTRLKVVINSFPKWKDYLKLSTWSRGNEGIFYIRDFNIEDENKKAVVAATSSWAAINIRTRKPEIVDGLGQALYSLKEKAAIDGKLEKLPESKHSKLLRKRRIEYTDIDLLYHVNNVKYIELIVNSFPRELHLSKTVKTLEVNYLDEVKYGEEILVFSDRKNGSPLVSIVRENDGKEVCRARLDWV